MPVDGYCFQSSTAIYIRRPVEGYAGLIDPDFLVDQPLDQPIGSGSSSGSGGAYVGKFEFITQGQYLEVLFAVVPMP